MTWKALTTVAFVLLATVVAGCGSSTLAAPKPTASASSQQAVAAHCAELVAKAMTSAAASVPGSYACLSPDQQRAAAGVGITDDASFEAFAGALGYDHERFLAATSDGGYVFEFDQPSGAVLVVTIWLDKSGKVTYLLFGANSNA